MAKLLAANGDREKQFESSHISPATHSVIALDQCRFPLCVISLDQCDECLSLSETLLQFGGTFFGLLKFFAFSAKLVMKSPICCQCISNIVAEQLPRWPRLEIAGDSGMGC